MQLGLNLNRLDAVAIDHVGNPWLCGLFIYPASLCRRAFKRRQIQRLTPRFRLLGPTCETQKFIANQNSFTVLNGSIFDDGINRKVIARESLRALRGIHKKVPHSLDRPLSVFPSGGGGLMRLDVSYSANNALC